MFGPLFKVSVACASLLLGVVVLLPTDVQAFTPYSTFSEFNAGGGTGTNANVTVPAGMLWVVENISGRILCPTDAAPTNAIVYQQRIVNQPAESVIFMTPQIVSLNAIVNGGPKDVYMFNMQTRAYYYSDAPVTINVSTTSDSGSLAFTSVSLIGHLEPLTNGDYNNSGIVDAADYVVWRNSVGQTSSLAADGNLNGAIEAGDYGVWSSTFGNHTTSTPLAASSAIPEPASGVLAGVALMLAWATRRKKR